RGRTRKGKEGFPFSAVLPEAFRQLPASELVLALSAPDGTLLKELQAPSGAVGRSGNGAEAEAEEQGSTTSPAPARYEAHIDEWTDNFVSGWVWDKSRPEEPVELELLAGD